MKFGIKFNGDRRKNFMEKKASSQAHSDHRVHVGVVGKVDYYGRM